MGTGSIASTTSEGRRRCGGDRWALLLVDDVRDAIREHAVGSREYVQSFSQQKDFPVLRCEVPEETLMNVLPRNSRLLMNRVFTKGLVGRVDVNLHVDELEAGVHLFVQEGQEGADVLRAFVPWFDTEVGEVRELQSSVFSKQCSGFLRRTINVRLEKFLGCLIKMCLLGRWRLANKTGYEVLGEGLVGWKESAVKRTICEICSTASGRALFFSRCCWRREEFLRRCVLPSLL